MYKCHTIKINQPLTQFLEGTIQWQNGSSLTLQEGTIYIIMSAGAYLTPFSYTLSIGPYITLIIKFLRATTYQVENTL